MEQQDQQLDIKDEISFEEFQILEQDDNKNNFFPVVNSEADVQSPCIRKCTSCRQPINAESYLSWELMDFCNDHCISNFQGTDFKCVNCPRFISAQNFGKYYIRLKNDFRLFCTQSCLEYYKSLVKICSYCQEEISNSDSLGIQRLGSSLNRVFFCSQTCCEILNGILKNDLPRVPPNIQCFVCKRDKPITIALKHDGISSFFCTQNCLTAYSFVKLQKRAEKCVLCQSYFSPVSLDGHTIFHENIQLNFCSLCCQNMYILLHTKFVSCTWCHNKRYKFGMIRKYSRNLFPFLDIDFCCVNCLKLYEASVINNVKRDPKTQNLYQGRSMPIEVPQGILSTMNNVPNQNITVTMPNVPRSDFIRVDQNLKENNCSLPISNKQDFFIQTTKNIQQRNVATMCFIPKAEKSNLARPATVNKMIQTKKPKSTKILLPVPVPIYVPSPVAMYSIPVITAVPFPVPIPVPIFVPTAQKSTADIMREIKKIQSSFPSDPYEAEILRIADVIADKHVEQSDEGGLSDVSEMKTLHEVNDAESCSDLRETSLEIEKGLRSNLHDSQTKNTSLQTTESINIKKGRKRCLNSSLVQDEIKLDKKLSQRQNDDLQLCIKTIDKKILNSNLGITAWEHWIRKRSKVLKKLAKNAKTFKSNILQMSSDELNSALCSFIKEIRKPNKSEYAPDTVYYLCLGIQRYLNQNGRSDNIFFDKMYNQFIDDFDQIAQNFCTLYNKESHFIVTRVEEEHLWETKQLGSHSPQVLLNTLIFFNTKYYYCSTVEQHMDISFSQILKTSKKKTNSKSLMLRFFPKKTKNELKGVGEQYENKNNHSRCPVRLYEFYLSKCPESAKAKHSLFYLQPEKYCISDSPLWYTTSPLDKKTLAKILNRIKMVKEINVALTTNN